jgi:hypothetical protein
MIERLEKMLMKERVRASAKLRRFAVEGLPLDWHLR